jgi:uncharacterized oxidoreductase
MKLEGNTLLLTGGGSGIGKALAHRFYDLGNTVIITGRRQDVLEKATDGVGASQLGLIGKARSVTGPVR